jgi:uncharacterized membrane protein YukC
MLLIIFTPLLMLADYFLTLLGKKYDDASPYVKSETYELNPRFRTAIDNKIKVNYRHLLLVALYTYLAFSVYISGDKRTMDFFSGYIVTMYGFVNARHISNILLHRYTKTNRNLIKGSIYVKHLYHLKHSLFNTIGIAIAFLLLLIFSPTAFILGGLISQMVLIIHHLSWIYKHKKIANRTLSDNWLKEEKQVQDLA